MNTYFQFKQFIIHQDRSAMKVTTDGCLFGAWVAHRLAIKENKANRLLDIGCGTGLLTLMIAQQNNIQTDAVEIDQAAAEQANENIATSPWKNNIRVIHSAIQQFTPPSTYDCIVSNPPFYENDLGSDNPRKNIAHHDKGLLLSELIAIIKRMLHPSGHFYLLLPYKRLDELYKLLTAEGLVAQYVVLISQSTKHSHFRVMVEGGFSKGNNNVTTSNKISIRDSRENYTDEFTELLKDYYLHL